MRLLSFFLGGLSVGAVLLVYNWLIFLVFDFFPDGSLVDMLTSRFGEWAVYAVIFLKGMVTGTLLMFFYVEAYEAILRDRGGVRDSFQAVVFFALYGITALVIFTMGDLLLMGTQEGMLVLLTIDGLIETLIATIPIRLFYFVFRKRAG